MPIPTHFKKFQNFYIPLAVLGIPLLLLGIGYWIGATRQKAYSDSQYIQEREKSNRLVIEAETLADTHLANEKKLATENELLRTQNQATAQILVKNDAKISGDTSKLVELQKQQQEKFKDIENEQDYDKALCEMCAEMKSAGFPLSGQTCARCQ